MFLEDVESDHLIWNQTIRRNIFVLFPEKNIATLTILQEEIYLYLVVFTYVSNHFHEWIY